MPVEGYHPKLDQAPFFGGGTIRWPHVPGNEAPLAEREVLQRWRREILARSTEYLKRDDWLFDPVEDLHSFLALRLRRYATFVIEATDVSESKVIPEELRDVLVDTSSAHLYLPTSTSPDHFTLPVHKIEVETPLDTTRIALVLPNYTGLYSGHVFDQSRDGQVSFIDRGEMTLHGLADIMTSLPTLPKKIPQP